jgi:hypothetical protein
MVKVVESKWNENEKKNNNNNSTRHHALIVKVCVYVDHTQ